MFGVGCLGTSIAEPFLRLQAAGIVPGINHTRSEPFVYSGLIGEDVELVILSSESIGSVKVDPTQIEQVIVNLAVNARDAMPEGGTLIIETTNVEFHEEDLKNHPDMNGGRYVMIAVSDTRNGMSEEVQLHIFEPFYTTKEKGKGTGLGLSTCYGIIAQNEGNIWVYSEIGSGTTFKVYLPILEGAHASSTPPPKPLSNELPRGTETVLLVEDEAQVRELTARVLRAAGLHCFGGRKRR